MFAFTQRTLALLAAPLLLASAVPVALKARQGFSGDGTFFETGLGACGISNTDADFIAAVGAGTFDSFPFVFSLTDGKPGTKSPSQSPLSGATANPNTNPICGRQIVANFEGKSVTVAITDRCAGCAGAADLDFSPAAFAQLADPSVGRLTGVTWDFV
ncbi:unnamed protein product [Mycena citricolor]|uniref:RlpA-like protein double-psi beta-barrel domain-containing protein n=1 Tax=Mycena citricolor TaxID=2018698 RepID=A0AAD2GU98_9AGAR|nr:unnamed protein product [Mycena citricolor]CAK5279708.1 unnamed protein product [Mycena citricolor]